MNKKRYSREDLDKRYNYGYRVAKKEFLEKVIKCSKDFIHPLLLPKFIKRIKNGK